MQKKPGLLQRLKNNRQQLIWMVTPVLLGVLLVVFWPETPCSKVVAKFEAVQRVAVEDQLLSRLDSLAFGAHCDTFSLVFEKKFWVLNRCKQAAEQLQDSLEISGLKTIFGEWMPANSVGTIVYHYPNLSIEYAQNFNSDYSFRLMYSREPLVEDRQSGWMSCEQAEKELPDAFFVSIDKHWYVSALKKKK